MEDLRSEMGVMLSVDLPWKILVGSRKLKFYKNHNNSLQETVIVV